MSPSDELVTEWLERVLQSALFKKADRQSRFLRHVVQKQLSGGNGDLKEISIGFEVYERPGTYDPKSDPIVRVEASRLRARLRQYYETAGAEDLVRIDLPKGGYVPTFEWRGVTPEAALESKPEPGPGIPAKPSPRYWIIGTALVIVVLASAAAAFWLRPPARARSIESIAVLPFADLSEKKDLSFLGDGLTEQIQEELVRIRNLRVIGSTSAKQASTNPDLRAAAGQIGADALLQGSIRAEDKKVRITARLLDGKTGAVMWSGSFDGERTDLFTFEEKIATALAAKLKIQLAVRREGVDERQAPLRVQAYDYYEQAQALTAQESVGSLDERYRLLQLAMASDPKYAPPHAAMADLLIRTIGSSMPAVSPATLGGAEARARALEEVNKALELDRGLPSAHVARIIYHRDIDLNWTKAREVCAASLRTYPNVADILQACGSVEGILWARAREVELHRRAVDLDPLSPRMHSFYAAALYRSGRLDDALNEADTAARLGSPGRSLYSRRALILVAKGDLAGGLKTIDDAAAHMRGAPEDWMMVRGYILGRLGRRAEVERLLQEYSRLGARPLQRGVMQLGMGERSKALDLFEQALETDRSALAHAIAQYYARVLDGDPRFETIKRKLGITG